jgi:hypothetical protein
VNEAVTPEGIEMLKATVRELEAERNSLRAELRDLREAVEAFLEPHHSHHLNTHRLEQTLAKWSRP